MGSQVAAPLELEAARERAPLDMGEAAQALRALGLSVFPCCWPDADGTCGCGQGHAEHAVGKAPLIRWGEYQIEPPHPDQVDGWWATWPDANIGLATGVVSGLLVFDADTDEGWRFLRVWVRRWVRTWCAATSKGAHVYFGHPNWRVPNSAGVLASGLDVRGDGGYVIAPPSMHKSGRRYAWLLAPHEAPLAPCPPELLALLAPRPASTTWTPRADDDGAFHVRRKAPILEGTRNDSLYRLALALRAAGAPPAVIAARLAEANERLCVPPLPAREVECIASSAARRPTT